jgi:hypothetical protein
MKKFKKILCFDLDNVICKTSGKNYTKSKPKEKVINLINELFEDGYFIKIFTARYMGRNNENIKKAKIQGYQFTKKQLDSWGLRYNRLIFGKPTYDVFVDDKSYNFQSNWVKDFRRYI